jgi:hypothetical protein
MIMKLLTVAAASMTISACSDQLTQAGAYMYPNFWGGSAMNAPQSSLVAAGQDPGITKSAPTEPGIFETRSESPTIWLFPPNPFGGGNN